MPGMSIVPWLSWMKWLRQGLLLLLQYGALCLSRVARCASLSQPTKSACRDLPVSATSLPLMLPDLQRRLHCLLPQNSIRVHSINMNAATKLKRHNTPGQQHPSLFSPMTDSCTRISNPMEGGNQRRSTFKCAHSCFCAAQAGQVESAVALWKRMQQEGVQPSADTFNAILTACLECQQNERALTLFQEAQTLGEAGGFPLEYKTTTARLQ